MEKDIRAILVKNCSLWKKITLLSEFFFTVVIRLLNAVSRLKNRAK